MTKQKNGGGGFGQIEVSLESVFLKRLPGISAKAKELIVKFCPWIVVVALVMSIPTLLAALGLGSLRMSAWRYGYVYGYNIAWWISISSMVVLMAIALPGLFKREIAAWRLMFYSSLVMAVYYLITMSLGSLIIGSGVSMYILFQVKSLYK